MKVLITGSTGMVGRNIRMLAEHNNIDCLYPSSQELNLVNYSQIATYIKDNKPDAIVHCAGLVGGIQANIAKPYDFCYFNLQMGLNVINAALEFGVSNVINLSSSCAYPRHAENPLVEQSILTGSLEPTNEGYAIAKIAIGKLTEYANQQYGTNFKTLIPCNLYGYWDKFDPENSHMIPAVIRKIHEAKYSGSPSVEIWGDGNARREFMFAEDLAEFILYGLDNINILPNIMNVGIGEDYSIKEYYQTITEVIEYDGEFTFNLDKPIGMNRKLVDTTAQQQLNWRMKTGLSAGIRKTYEYFLNEVY